jgi:2-methylisocitrate lyase-like PEP mutase family enzyme
MSASQIEAFERFRALHQAPGAFVLANAWDATSAVILKNAGFQALGTSSAAIAHAMGRADGRHAVSRAEAVANGALLGSVTGLPVNGDLEDGFGPTPAHCVATVKAAIAGGLAGVGIEDTTADPDHPIHDFDSAVARVAAAAEAARGRIVLTGRTDLFLNGQPDLDEAIRRLTAFAEVGADVLYAPGLPDMKSIRAVVKAVAPKPVNVLLGPWGKFGALDDLAKAGVKRVSLGSALFANTLGHLERTAARIAAGDIAVAVKGNTRISFDSEFG